MGEKDRYAIVVNIEHQKPGEKPGERRLGELINYLEERKYRIYSSLNQTSEGFWDILLLGDGEYNEISLDKDLKDLTKRLDLSYSFPSKAFTYKTAIDHVKKAQKMEVDEESTQIDS